jgi:hypothetical protein
MAYVHGESFPTSSNGDSIQASATETHTTAESLGLPPSFWRRHRKVLALAATVAFAGGGSAAFFLTKDGGSGSEGRATGDKGGTAGGLAPAVSPSTRSRAPGVVGTRSAVPSPSASKRGGGVPAITPSSHDAPASPKYDDNAKFDCTGIKVSRNGDILHVTPQLTKKGKPNPAKFITVADYVHGVNPAAESNNHQVFSAAGYGSAVDIKVPADLNWQEDAATVMVAYYHGGDIPTDPNQLSIQNTDPARVSAACGNAVITWAMQTDQMGGLGSGG